ncbi:MAG: crotonase/enoyl-CoA hydratase family protein [Candidatus Nanopelagicales bacterium]
MTPVLQEVRGRVLVVTINRPEARNAINLATAEGLAEAMERLDADVEVHAAVITGAGGTFCAGMDLKAFSRGQRPVVPGRGFAGIAAAPPAKPLIAAVEGYALAGGFEMVLACDLVVASRSAQFGLPEVKRGLTAAAGGLFRLPRRIPFHQAMELVLTGRMWSAEEAERAGLVSRLCEPGEALDSALELATVIARNAPMAVVASKRVIVDSQHWTDAEAFVKQEEIVDPVRRSSDAREGAHAFAEKREPRWSGV